MKLQEVNLLTHTDTALRVKVRMRYYRSAEEIVAHRLHQGKDAEARGDADHQGAGSRQGLCLLFFDFTQKSLEKSVTSSDLIS